MKECVSRKKGSGQHQILQIRKKPRKWARSLITSTDKFFKKSGLRERQKYGNRSLRGPKRRIKGRECFVLFLKTQKT